MEVKKLLLTTDFSSCSRMAFDPAADLARRMGASIDLVNCLVYPPQATPAGFLDFQGPLDVLRKARRRQLELAAAEPTFKGLAVTPRFLEGDGPETVHEFARETGADLIVQSSHGSNVKRFFLGSFAERLLSISSIPVLTFRSSEGPAADLPREFRPRRILFPYDYSPAAREALPPVRRLASTYGSKVLVLHAWMTPAQLLIQAADGIAVDVDALPLSDESPQKLLQDLRAFARQELLGIDHEEQVLAGDPATLIVARAETYGADLVCMSTHGFTGLRRIFLGSVTERVLRGAPCPTWIVPASRSRLGQLTLEDRQLAGAPA